METVPQQNPLKIFVVAENALLREGIARLLGEKQGISIVGASPVTPKVPEQMTSGQTEIVLVGPGSIAASGPELIQELIRRVPGVNVVLVAMDADEQIFLRSVRAGAVGYVLKEASVAELESAVHAVSRGEVVCPPQLCSFLFRYLRRQAAELPAIPSRDGASLSRRERQLVPLIAGGLTNKEIASQLCLSEQTIKNHIHRMLRKLGADDRLKAAEMATFDCWAESKTGQRQNAEGSFSINPRV